MAEPKQEAGCFLSLLGPVLASHRSILLAVCWPGLTANLSHLSSDGVVSGNSHCCCCSMDDFTPWAERLVALATRFQSLPRNRCFHFIHLLIHICSQRKPGDLVELYKTDVSKYHDIIEDLISRTTFTKVEALLQVRSSHLRYGHWDLELLSR